MRSFASIKYIPAGEEGNEFPILINSNKHLLEAEVRDGTVRIRMKDTEGKVYKTFNF